MQTLIGNTWGCQVYCEIKWKRKKKSNWTAKINNYQLPTTLPHRGVQRFGPFAKLYFVVHERMRWKTVEFYPQPAQFWQRDKLVSIFLQLEEGRGQVLFVGLKIRTIFEYRGPNIYGLYITKAYLTQPILTSPNSPNLNEPLPIPIIITKCNSSSTKLTCTHFTIPNLTIGHIISNNHKHL